MAGSGTILRREIVEVDVLGDQIEDQRVIEPVNQPRPETARFEL